MRISQFIFLLSTALAAQTSFVNDVQPILRKQCSACHQPASKASGLDVTSFLALQVGGGRGPAFTAGDPDASLTIKYVTGTMQPKMPLGLPALSAAEIDALRNWIKAGAKDDSPREALSRSQSAYTQAPVITALRYSPDGKTLAVSGNGEVLLHRADGSGIVKRLSGDAERLLSLAFSSDGKVLVVGGGTPSRFGEVQVWDVAEGKQKQAIKLTSDTVFGASLSPDSERIAVGCTDNTVHVFETSTGKEVYKINNHENWVLATAFGINSKRFVSVGRDRAAKLIDASTGLFQENVNLLRGELTAIARHPQKDIVVIGGEDRIPYIYLLDRPKNMKIADDTTLVRKLDRQNGAIMALDWSGDGKWIAVAGASPEVKIYDSGSGEVKATLKGHEAGIYSLSFTPDGTQLATGGFDGKVRIYAVPGGALVKEFVPVPLVSNNLSAGAAR